MLSATVENIGKFLPLHRTTRSFIMGILGADTICLAMFMNVVRFISEIKWNRRKHTFQHLPELHTSGLATRRAIPRPYMVIYELYRIILFLAEVSNSEHPVVRIGGAMIAIVLCNPRIPKGSFLHSKWRWWSWRAWWLWWWFMTIIVIMMLARVLCNPESPGGSYSPPPKWPSTINWVRMVVKSNHGNCDGDGGGNYSVVTAKEASKYSVKGNEIYIQNVPAHGQWSSQR